MTSDCKYRSCLASISRNQDRLAKMFTRVFYDEFGQSYLRVDEDLKQRIECKLMAQIILKFKI